MILAALVSALVALSPLLVVAYRAAAVERTLGAHSLGVLGFHFMLVDALHEMARASLLDARHAPALAMWRIAPDGRACWATEPDRSRWC